MSVSLKVTKTESHCIALFPGAFRPPHRAHYATVVSLAESPDIDEVVVIITNRCRHIPGTTKVLDTEIAEKIWAIYLKDMSNVRVEVATYSAVKHAINYFEKADPGDCLLFCAGESVLDEGRGRFSKIDALARQYNIQAQVIASPVPALSGGATAVRACLAKGDTGFDDFKKALPEHLTKEQYEDVWQICQQGMQEMQQLASKKIQHILTQLGVDDIETINHASYAPDAIHCVQCKSGKRMFVKHANDTVKAATLGQSRSLKPRNRLYAERRALKWLTQHNVYGIELPEVIFFESKVKTLVLSEVFPGKQSLEDDLMQGVYDPVIAWKIGEFLACCHRGIEQVPSFWGEKHDDCQHWEKLLNLRTLKLQTPTLSNQINQQLAKLSRASKEAIEVGFFHLDFSPKNIRLENQNIGVIDFELCSSIADPACDFGFFLGQIIFFSVLASSEEECQQFIHTAVSSYRKGVAELWSAMSARSFAFAGATIIHCVDRYPQAQKVQKQLLNIASELLLLNLESFVDINSIFRILNNFKNEKA